MYGKKDGCEDVWRWKEDGKRERVKARKGKEMSKMKRGMWKWRGEVKEDVEDRTERRRTRGENGAKGSDAASVDRL